jgi:serine/threonine-protein kinase
VGTVLSGRYEIEDVVAEGGMATVYRARHRVMNRECAIKIMSAMLVRNKVVRERFRREAKATQTLAHPNIIEILDHGETDDRLPYLAMEYLRGETLADMIARGPISFDIALPVAVQIARALARAHDFDVIHRDLKPENVFLCQRDGIPVAKLLDFGIARSLHDARLTAAGEVFGTPQYMAPERITSIDAGPSADLYALGVMLFEMLVGTLPFPSEDVPTFFAQHMRKPAPHLRDHGVKAPDSLEDLLASLMAKTPEERPVDAHRVHNDLLAISDELSIVVPSEAKTADARDVQSPTTLPPASTDKWTRRTVIFEQMLSRAHGNDPPAEPRDLLATIQRRVREISVLRADSIKEQRELSALENKTREGRQRFGFAVDALGVDASKARDAARDARSQAEEAVKKSATHVVRMRELHEQIMAWEGRSAFQEPYPELAAAYRAAAGQIDEWLVCREADCALRKRADELESMVTDLEYQLNELRAGLTRLEQSAETERATLEARSTELGQKADTLEQELLQLASDFCQLMRSAKELQPLFRQLEST